MARRQSFTFRDFNQFLSALPNDVLGGMVKAATGTLEKRYGRYQLEVDWSIVERSMYEFAGYIKMGMTYDQIISRFVKKGGINRALWNAIDKTIKEQGYEGRLVESLRELGGTIQIRPKRVNRRGVPFSLGRLPTSVKMMLYPIVHADIRDLYYSEKYGSYPEVYVALSGESAKRYRKYLKGNWLTPGQIKGIHTNKTRFTKK